MGRNLVTILPSTPWTSSICSNISRSLLQIGFSGLLSVHLSREHFRLQPLQILYTKAPVALDLGQELSFESLASPVDTQRNSPNWYKCIHKDRSTPNCNRGCWVYGWQSPIETISEFKSNTISSKFFVEVAMMLNYFKLNSSVPSPLMTNLTIWWMLTLWTCSIDTKGLIS
jgi:hypothetical protein